MPRTATRLFAVALVCAVTVVVAERRLEAAGPVHFDGDGATVELSPELRDKDLTFDPSITPQTRSWVLGALAAARPEAQRLIDEVDGLVTITSQAGIQDAIGTFQASPDGIFITLDLALLNGERALDRNVVVLHELGHLIDFALVDDPLIQQLDVLIPQVGTCESATEVHGACTALEERFADTFAKWALRGEVSLAGSGYGIPAPRSLEDWGTPLGRLAAEMTIRAASG